MVCLIFSTCTVYKFCIYILLLTSLLIWLCLIESREEEDSVYETFDELTDSYYSSTNINRVTPRGLNEAGVSNVDKYFNIWCIFTKVKNSNSYFRNRFNTMITSVLKHSSVHLSFNVISDPKSKICAQQVFDDISHMVRSTEYKVIYHDVRNITSQLAEVTAVMSPYFSTRPGDYFSDPIFYISLGLHRVAPSFQARAIILDIDLKFVADIKELFEEFDKFEDWAVFGLGPELSPTYRNDLSEYRSHHKNTRFGRPLAVGGFQGVNSGVLLLRLDRMRSSREFHDLLTPSAVKELTEQYSFKGRLGDQDFYTLVGMSHPHLLYQLSCGWNMQLCYRYTNQNHSFDRIEDVYSYCGEPTKVYHGNCKSPLPPN